MKVSKLVLPKIKTELVKFDLPWRLLADIKNEAMKKDISYKSLIKCYLDIAVKSNKLGKLTFAS